MGGCYRRAEGTLQLPEEGVGMRLSHPFTQTLGLVLRAGHALSTKFVIIEGARFGNNGYTW